MKARRKLQSRDANDFARCKECGRTFELDIKYVDNGPWYPLPYILPCGHKWGVFDINHELILATEIGNKTLVTNEELRGVL